MKENEVSIPANCCEPHFDCCKIQIFLSNFCNSNLLTMLSEGSSCIHLVVVSNQVGLYALQFGSTSAVKGKSNKSTCFEHAVL